MAESEPEGSREEGGERRSEGGEGTKRGNRFARTLGKEKGRGNRFGRDGKNEFLDFPIPAHSHDGNIQQFGLYFVKTGVVSHDMGRLLKVLFGMRQTGDYSDRFDLTEEDVVPKIQPTEDFINLVTKLAKVKLGL